MSQAPGIPPCHLRCGAASASWDGTTLRVATGLVARSWRRCAEGFATCGLEGPDGLAPPLLAAEEADWRLPGGLPMADSVLGALELDEDDDEGFTTRHLRVRFRLDYPAAGVRLEGRIWAWPGAPGLRSAFRLAALPGRMPTGAAAGYAAVGIERLPLRRGLRARAAGYYNQTQRRNDLATPLLRDEALPPDGVCDWASIAALEGEDWGAALVKESNKCVNQPSHDSGAFVWGSGGLVATGWGLLPGEIGPDGAEAWAHWTLLYRPGHEGGLEGAVRRLFALRYPEDPRRDGRVQSNTWGSSAHARDARDAACEVNVLRELEAAVEAGVEVVQVDDGWQVPANHPGWQPPEGAGWRPDPGPWPAGWGRLRARAAELGLELGLWAAGQPIPLEDLRWNREQGGFTQFKLDFMHLRDRAAFDALVRKVRAFIAGTGQAVRVNWDATEIEPRAGYFALREFGSLYLANRKPCLPAEVLYRPHTMLRDVWELARFQRLQSVQITVQDPERTMSAGSDAHRHPHAYCLAIALFATPLLFLQVQLLSPPARRAIRRLLDAWKPHRAAIRAGEVEPVGEAPSNASLTGLRCRCPDGGGYLLLFREIGCERTTMELAWPGAIGRIEDVVAGGAAGIAAFPGGLRIDLPDAPGFRLLRLAPMLP